MAGMVSIASAADTIVVSMKGPGAGNPFWAAVQRGAEERGKELGVNVVVLAPPTESDVAAQIAQIEDQPAKGVKGIVLAPTDPNALAPVVDEAIADGVPVVFVDTKGINAGVPTLKPTTRPVRRWRPNIFATTWPPGRTWQFCRAL